MRSIRGMSWLLGLRSGVTSACLPAVLPSRPPPPFYRCLCEHVRAGVGSCEGVPPPSLPLVNFMLWIASHIFPSVSESRNGRGEGDE